MNTSAAPLLLTMIATIIVMALAVHAEAVSDPAYGSDLRAGAASVLAFAVQ